MTEHKKVVVFQDRHGQFPPGRVFYPESLLLITHSLEELRKEEMGQPKYFNTNVQLFLGEIIRYFEGIHDNHTSAKTIFEQYRTEGRQYCLYLRNFWLSGLRLGVNIERNYSLYGFDGSDRRFRQLVKKSLKGHINSLSFVNIRDFYYPSDTESDYKSGFTIPSFRVLNHNWRDIVSETIKGAKLIVLNLQSETEGVQLEANVIRECGMARRTICIVGKKYKYPDALNDFYDTVEVQSFDADSEDAPGVERFMADVERLANDDFMQTNQVRDLSGLKCYVIDRNIDLALSQYEPETLSDVAYEDYLPSSLLNNWTLFSQHYPKMVEHWGEIEEQMRVGRHPGVEKLADTMYEALGTFYLAVTLERYEEMAFSVSTVGLAHRLITGQDVIMADCYRHAMRCAAWGGNTTLAKFYSDVCEDLRS